MAKHYGSPLFRMRLKEDLYDWLRDYSKRRDQPMSSIIKEHLETLRRKDELAKRNTQEA